MAPKPILLFLTCLTFLPCYLLDDTSLLTNDQFEQVFAEHKSMKAFQSYPFYAYLFTTRSSWLGSSLVPIPECLVTLLKEGIGKTDSKCVKILKKSRNKGEKKYSRIRLAFRCLKSDNPFDYDLHIVPIDNVTIDGFGYKKVGIYFTPQQADHCQAAYSEVENLDSFQESDSELNEEPDLTEKLQQLFFNVTEKQFNDAFDDEYGASITITTHGYVFVPHLEKLDGTLIPVSDCMVGLRRYNRGLIAPECAESVKSIQKANPNLPIFIAYRCYNLPNSGEYELHTVPIERIEESEESQLIDVCFKPKETNSNCEPIWMEDFEERINLEEHFSRLLSTLHDEF